MYEPAHVHSEWSDDASWPLSRIASTFARWRFDVVLMSEHSRGFTAAKWAEYVSACAAASNDRVTLVPGIEYGDGEDVVHIPVWGAVPFFGETPHIGALLADVSQAGGTAVWAHPWRRDAWRRFDPSWHQYLGAIEVWNRKYDGIAPNSASIELARKQEAQSFVSLDFHNRRQLFPLSLALRLQPQPADAYSPKRAVQPDDVFTALRSDRLSARAFGVPIERLTARGPAMALKTLETTRRLVARFVG